MGLPLEGVRILSVEQFGAGPFATLTLADLGAEVIKIEDPTVNGDVSRHVPPYCIENDSLYFQAFNRNKRSLTLDMRKSEGVRVFHDLVRVSDAVFNNLRGDQPGKLGLTYGALKEINPRIVCASLSGFGQTGPKAAEPGYDYIFQAMAGHMSVTGDPDGPPTKSGISVIDLSGGFTAALGLMIGLYAAKATGIGRDVDVSLFDTALSMLSYLAAWNLNKGLEPQRLPDSAHLSIVPCQNFKTRDSHIVVMCAKEKFWQLLAQRIGREDLLGDERFTDFAARLKNKETLLSILKQEFRQRTTQEWIGLLQGYVPCGPVNSITQALQEPQTLAREMVIEFPHPVFGQVREVGCPIKISEAESAPRRAPELGEDNEMVLGEYLRYSAAQIQELRACGAI
jgi:crotonobetainyl-CoA:carnitine CoA-transferase CaiB-like acyl-CoA transferase